jgi:chemotaxis protein MotB
MRRSPRPWCPARLERAPFAAALALAALTAGGCVTRGTYREATAGRDEALAENARLAKRVKLLEASNESLSAERLELIDAVESLRETQAGLESSVAELRRRHEDATRALGEREEELGKLRDLRGSYESLVADLEAEVQAGRIEVERLREGLRVNLSDEILFDSGSAQLKPSGREVLARVAARLRELPDRVEVQGHTDNVPIKQGWPSNWELAAARATGVVRFLQGEGVPPGRLSGVSYGEYHPVAPNDQPEGRARNRRIELRLLPDREGSAAASPAVGE